MYASLNVDYYDEPIAINEERNWDGHMGCKVSKLPIGRTSRAQSAMEYLMTYGWAILIIAVVLAALFELGVFNGSNLAPQACIAESGFICKNPVYTANGITFTFGQTTGRDYYGDWIFVAAQGEALDANGIPVGLVCNAKGCTSANKVGSPGNVLIPGQTVQVDFSASDFRAGGVPSNPTIGTPFAGYIWLGYCFSPCSSPTAYSKVATITIKSAGVFAGSTTTPTSSTTTTTISSASTTTISGTPCANNWLGGACVGNVTYTNSMDLSDTIRVSGNVIIRGNVRLTTMGFAIISGGSFINNGLIVTGPANNGASGETNTNQHPGGSVPNSYGGSGGGAGWPYCNGGPSAYGGNTLLPDGIGGASGSPGSCNGGAPGNGATPPLPSTKYILSNINSWYANGMQNYLAGAGGGTCSGCTGDGGSGAFGLYIQANSIYNYGTIDANGYAGYNAGASCPNFGGGSNGCWNDGGGGGGFVLLAYHSIFSDQGSITTLGGSGNIPGNHSSGGTGGPGQYTEVQYASPPVQT